MWPVGAFDEFDDPGKKSCTQIQSWNRITAYQSVSSLPGAKTARICKHARLFVDFVGQEALFPFPTEFSNFIAPLLKQFLPNGMQDRQENCGGNAAQPLSLLAVKPPRHWLTPQTHTALPCCASEHLVVKRKKRFASTAASSYAVGSPQCSAHFSNEHAAQCALMLEAVCCNVKHH